MAEARMIEMMATEIEELARWMDAEAGDPSLSAGGETRYRRAAKLLRSLSAQNEARRAALEDALPLCVGWASHWQFDNKTPEFHETHQAIIDRVTALSSAAGDEDRRAS